jgi:hypothetical protein
LIALLMDEEAISDPEPEPGSGRQGMEAGSGELASRAGALAVRMAVPVPKKTARGGCEIALIVTSSSSTAYSRVVGEGGREVDKGDGEAGVMGSGECFANEVTARRRGDVCRRRTSSALTPCTAVSPSEAVTQGDGYGDVEKDAGAFRGSIEGCVGRADGGHDAGSNAASDDITGDTGDSQRVSSNDIISSSM